VVIDYKGSARGVAKCIDTLLVVLLRLTLADISPESHLTGLGAITQILTGSVGVGAIQGIVICNSYLGEPVKGLGSLPVEYWGVESVIGIHSSHTTQRVSLIGAWNYKSILWLESHTVILLDNIIV
tara:strand:+ start:941 stop:1318 length:378 start_codon:yes stop_codon:yes gene_type:complete